MTGNRLKRLARRLLRWPAAAAMRSPHVAMRGADLLGSAMFWRTPPVIGQVFAATQGPRGKWQLRRRMARTSTREKVIALALHGGGRAAVRGLLRNRSPVSLPPAPLILATFHVGPAEVLGAALHSQQAPLMTLRNTGMDADECATPEQKRAARFIRALRFLQEGGLVLLAVDSSDTTFIRVPFMGATLRLARGAFALARLTGAEIVPIVARWSGTKVDVVVGEPLNADANDVEASLAASAARWLESYLTRHPEEITSTLLDHVER